jgi:hypothetical protein
MPLLDFSITPGLLKRLRFPGQDAHIQQELVLKKLLTKARFTQFGQHYRFDEMLLQDNIISCFRDKVPIFNYNSLYSQWWHKAIEGVPDVCWPGQIKYFALSSGTSESSSKYIPVTTDLLKGNRNIMIRQLLTLRNYEDINLSLVGRGWLMLGGSTALEKNAGYYAGDLSGITALKVPFWFQPFYKPGRKIAKEKDWNKKLNEIVSKAPEWDIGFLTGVPAWIQMCLEMIIKEYKLNTIHDIWPNLSFFVHGGVSFEPYRLGFEKLLKHPLTYVETYLASEGFLAYQAHQYSKGMQLSVYPHIFFEFIPFDERNFDAEGEVLPSAVALSLQDVQEGVDYALLISTTAGAWRYLIGDTIRFVDKDACEIVITGRTKHFLNLVGEHLSVENMNRAVQHLSENSGIPMPEFTVAGKCFDNHFSHHWYIAAGTDVNAEKLLHELDAELQRINDDYITERKHALKQIALTTIPESVFTDFMRSKNKLGGQHKFPRVIKGKMLEDWELFLRQCSSTQQTAFIT